MLNAQSLQPKVVSPFHTPTTCRSSWRTGGGGGLAAAYASASRTICCAALTRSARSASVGSGGTAIANGRSSTAVSPPGSLSAISRPSTRSLRLATPLLPLPAIVPAPVQQVVGQDRGV